MEFLLFRLYAPLASWGDVAVGEFRPTLGCPGRSALLGLIGAALGVDRDDEARHRHLDTALTFAIAVYAEGTLLRDYHTAQVPGAADLKGRPHRTRSDELAVARHDLNTILSRRDYRQDALCIAAAWLRPGTTNVDLSEICGALARPCFTLYLGRKACPPALPLSPQLVDAADVRSAVGAANFPAVDELAFMRGKGQPLRVAWEDEVDIGWPESFSILRKDAPVSRQRWQFRDRIERIALTAATDLGYEDDGEPAR